MPAIHLLIKPASGSCNMRCEYCFYADEVKNRSIPSYGIMNHDTLEAVLSKALSYAEGQCTLSFQGGEPTLAGLRYFQDVIALTNSYRPKALSVSYSIQTNGYSLDEEWISFFAKYHFLVGISLDGYKEIHDSQRRDAEGNGTFTRVQKSIRLLKQYGVDFNILTVVTSSCAKHIGKIYNFYKRNNFTYQQYIECLDPLGIPAGQQPYSLTPKLYASFLKELFDRWYLDMKQGNYIYIRYFENLAMILLGSPPESCNMRGTCGIQWVIEADGSAYPCDFYVLDQWKLGNFLTDSMETMQKRRSELNFIERSFPLPNDCKTCRWLNLCRNGCARNCEPIMPEHRPKNYFCQSYQEFFEYAIPRFEELLRSRK